MDARFSAIALFGERKPDVLNVIVLAHIAKALAGMYSQVGCSWKSTSAKAFSVKLHLLLLWN